MPINIKYKFPLIVSIFLYIYFMSLFNYFFVIFKLLKHFFDMFSLFLNFVFPIFKSCFVALHIVNSFPFHIS